MGLRKVVVLAVVACLSVFLVGPAQADSPERCSRWERKVFAVTTTGGLVQHTFCLDSTRRASRWTDVRVIATNGWADTAAAFWTGTMLNRGAYYRVSASTGALYWSVDLQSWKRIGVGRDWRGYTSLISTEPGVIYATEPSGTVRRLVHLGWQDGLDSWAQDVPVVVLPGVRLLGPALDGFVGVTAGMPGLAQVWSNGFALKLHIIVPSGVDQNRLVPFDLERVFTDSAFGLTFAGRLVVLLPTNRCEKADRAWRAEDETGSGYRMIFAGGFLPYGGGPVEWQCGMPPGPVN